MANKNYALSLVIFDEPTNRFCGPVTKAYIADWQFHVARFPSIGSMAAFCKRFRLHLKPTEQYPNVKKYAVRERFHDRLFINVEELPSNAEPMKVLSNGSIVTGYVSRDGDVITVWRPNPNVKSIYDPMPLDEHIAYEKANGVF